MKGKHYRSHIDLVRKVAIKPKDSKMVINLKTYKYQTLVCLLDVHHDFFPCDMVKTLKNSLFSIPLFKKFKVSFTAI